MKPWSTRFNQLRRQAATAELAVLVWGPGPSDPTGYAKREKIKQALIDTFPQAEVAYSEDLETSIATLWPGADSLRLVHQESLHLAACDLCVVLDLSKGSGEELAHFVNSPNADKLLVFTHERFKLARSFPGAIRESMNQVFYTDDEFETCRLVEKALARAEIVALTKLRLS